MNKHKFTLDKAEWQQKTACEVYSKAFHKPTEALTQQDHAVIWEYCANHIAVFLTWVIEQDFLSKLHDDNLQDAAGVKERRITGFEFLSNHCDLVLSREDLSRKIVKFVDLFYEDYIEQYCEFMENKLHKTVLGTTFSWEDYALIKANIIDPGYHKYLNNQSCK